MREFEKYEMFKTKCPVCGSKNKVHTELMDRAHRFVGYSLKCCNCGNYNEFLLDYENNGKVQRPYGKSNNQRCIQLSYCPKKDCKLYGTCTVEKDDIDFKKPLVNHDNDQENTVSIELFNKPRFL